MLDKTWYVSCSLFKLYNLLELDRRIPSDQVDKTRNTMLMKSPEYALLCGHEITWNYSIYNIIWLVVDLPLWKIWKSMGRMTSHIWNGKYFLCSKPPTSYDTISGQVHQCSLHFFSTARWIPIFVHPCPREKGRALKAAWRRAWLGSTLWSKKLGDQHDLKEHAAHVGIIHFRLWGYRNNMRYLGFTNICFAEFFGTCLWIMKSVGILTV